MTALQQHIHHQKITKDVVRACQHLLLTSPKAQGARKYLDSRLSRANQMLWQMGFFPPDESIEELISVVDKETLASLTLYYPRFLAGGSAPHGHFSEHNLVMPFHNVYGDVVAILGRSLLSEDDRREAGIQKYKYTAGCQKDLYVYGLDKAKSSIIEKNFVIGVEGQFDCIALHDKGIRNAVAFGWANVSKYQMFQILRYTNNIILMFDNDEAGQKAKTRVKDRFKGDANIKLISPPEGFKDIEEFFRRSNDKVFVKRVIERLATLEINGKENQ